MPPNEMDDNLTNLVSDRNSLINFSKMLEQLIETQMKQMFDNSSLQSMDHSTNQISPSRFNSANSVKNLCDKVHLFRKSCLTYAEESLTPQQRFRLRELLIKLEKNSDSLRSSNNIQSERNSLDHQKLGHLFSELQTNIRDIITVVQK